MRKHLILLLLVFVIVGAGSWLAVRVQSQSVETPQEKANEYLEAHQATDEMMPYRVSLRDRFGIDFSENSQWVIATDHDSLIAAGLIGESPSREQEMKLSAWDVLWHRYYSGRVPLAYWNRSTPNVAAILTAPDGGKQWAYREFLYNDASQDWELTEEQVIPNPIAEGLGYSYDVVRDKPRKGDITLRVHVVDKHGSELTAVWATFIVPDIGGFSPSPEIRPGVARSPFDIVFNAEHVSQLPDEAQVEVILINDLSGEMLRETITVNTR